MNQAAIREVIAQLGNFLPSVQQWIEEYCSQHTTQAIPVEQCGFGRLGQYFGVDRLKTARVVQVDRISFPPLTQMGFPYLQEFEEQGFGGITYHNMYFLTREAYSCEATHFHELVHVVQWNELGVERFLTAYGVGLLSAGYRHSPLERMAYDFQKSFDQGILIPDLERTIREKTVQIATALGL
jgi:hypothetical protein